jgi:hypothetical protein
MYKQLDVCAYSEEIIPHTYHMPILNSVFFCQKEKLKI